MKPIIVTLRKYLEDHAKVYARLRDEYGRYVQTRDDNHDEYAASVVHYSAMTVAYNDLLLKLPASILDTKIEIINYCSEG